MGLCRLKILEFLLIFQDFSFLFDKKMYAGLEKIHLNFFPVENFQMTHNLAIFASFLPGFLDLTKKHIGLLKTKIYFIFNKKNVN